MFKGSSLQNMFQQFQQNMSDYLKASIPEMAQLAHKMERL